MTQKKIWAYAAIMFVLTGSILATQVSWIFQSARIEESFLNQRVNMALCSAMDVLSKDRALCSNVESCVSHGHGTFEISFNAQEKHKIDSVIGHHLMFYNIQVPFQTTFTPYVAHGTPHSLPLDQALLYPAKAGKQNVLVNIDIPSKPQLIRAQINGMFILSMIVLLLLILVFIRTLQSLYRERKVRSDTVDFINNMAHDLKTPISNISFAASLLEKGDKNSIENGKRYISIINEEAVRLKERARKILGAASVSAVVDDNSERTQIDIHQVIEECVHAFVFKLQETQGQISSRLLAMNSVVTGSHLQLTSAVMNIIDNAISYNTGVPDIRISTRNEGSAVCIEIEDNGPGIAIREQELVFRKAYRIRNGKKSSEGFGLGLYLARTLVEKHGGKLSLSSDGITGSCFRIRLPIT